MLPRFCEKNLHLAVESKVEIHIEETQSDTPFNLVQQCLRDEVWSFGELKLIQPELSV